MIEKMIKLLRLPFLPALLLLAPAAVSQPVQTDHVEAELVSEVSSIEPGVPFRVALRLEMDEHWHVYWENPGDAGMRPHLKWQLPEGFSASGISWPYPEKIIVSGLANYGYEGEIFLPVTISPPQDLQPGETVALSLEASWLVCKIECLPGKASLSLSLPVTGGGHEYNQSWVDAFSATDNRIPLTESGWQASGSYNDSLLTLSLTPPEWYDGKLSNITFFPVNEGIFHNAGEQSFAARGDNYTLTVQLEANRIAEPDSIRFVMVAESGWRGAGSEKAAEFTAYPIPEGEKAAAGPEISLLLALGFAFIGGIILNLMPCVLPVISLKILGFVQQSGEDRGKIVFHGILFTAGVLASFLVLAGLLLALRAGGEELGWGFQLQSPHFLAVLSILLFVFGLSLFGMFEIGTSLTAMGGGGNTGAFVSGITATILATPCTAPFMGSALGFAIAQPPVVTLAVFASLGLGMAFPYLLLSVFPQWLKYLPKPGAWMESLKQFMGFLLMGTIIWLIWVFGIQAGLNSIIFLLGALLLAGLGSWIYGRWGTLQRSTVSRRIALAMFILTLGGSLYVSLSFLPDTAPAATMQQGGGESIDWVAYDEGRYRELREEGKALFIDFTAAWCLSCQVNERVALSGRDVAELFEEKGVTSMKADWTSRNDEITRALARYGRNSVPLYVLYKPGAAEPEILPEILTPAIVKESISSIQ